MGSLRFDGIRFTAYTMDHAPRHVHGFYADIEVIVDLRLDGSVLLARRKDAVRPGNGSVANVRHVLNVAAQHFEKLAALWEKHHG
ncbi:MAG: DUF4160 domain-containing protein [Terracidiphilus sp.]